MKRMLALLIALTIALSLVACNSQPQTTAKPSEPTQPAQAPKPAEVKYVHPEVLVSVDQLKGLMSDPKLVLVDIRKAEDYAKGHLPGAVNIYRPDYTDPDNKIKEMRATPVQMEKLLQKIGINTDSKVVLYGDAAAPMDPTRFWWQLDLVGFKNAQILNGCINKWTETGNKTVTDPVQPKQGNLKLDAAVLAIKDKLEKNTVVDMADMVKAVNAKDKNVVIVDARTADEYNGVTVKDLASRKGRVPGAINIDYVQLLAVDKTFKPAADLKKLFEDKGVTPDKQVYVYCHSGARSSLEWFALTQLLGYPKVANFDPSWIGWSNDQTLPIEPK